MTAPPRSTVAHRRLADELRAYLPEHLAARLAAGDFPPPGVAERIHGVALFSDVSGFTPLSEGLTRLGREGAERLTAILNRHFDRMVDLVREHGGSVVKYGGDAMTILFADARSAAERCAAAAACAARMQEALAEYGNVEVAELSETFTLRMKIGISTGTMSQGVVGDSDGLEFVVAGAALDEMAEAEHHAAAGEIVVSAAVAECLAGTAEFGPPEDGFRKLLAAPLAPPPLPPPPKSLDPSLAAPFLPRAVVEQLRAGGRAALAGEHRKVTTTFLLFSGLDYDGDPEAFAKLQAYYLSASRTCRRFGGRVNRVITGDKGSLLHLIFGAPVSHEDDETRAVLTALHLLAEPLPFVGTQKMGLNTGSVFCGNVGPDERREYTIMGDAVNLAARLMQAADPGQILCSSTTREKTSGAFEWKVLPPIRVKGKSAEFVPSVPLASREVTSTSELPLLGRAGELDRLGTSASAAISGRGAWIHVEGEAGIGKSRLVEEVISGLGPGVDVARGKALSWGKDSPWSMWGSLLLSVLRLRASSSPADRRTALERLARERLAGRPADSELVGAALGWWESNAARGVDESVVEQRVHAALDRLIAPAGSPAALFVDDVQHADPASLRFLAFLARAVEEKPVLLVTAGREGAELPGAPEPGERTTVGPLTPAAVEALAVRLLRRGTVDPELAELLASRSRGNPLYVASLVRHLLDQGSIRLEEETSRWYLAPGAAGSALPESVGDLLLAAIDALPALRRTALRTASVFGDSFSLPLLSRVLGVSAEVAELEAELGALSDFGVELAGTDDRRTGTFTQALVRDVAYDSLPFERRRELHSEIGTALEEEAGSDAAELAPILARHFSAARDDSRALRWARLAGERELAAGASEAARAHLTIAIEAASRTDETLLRNVLLELLPLRADAAGRVGNLALAFEDFRSAYSLVARRRDHRRMSEICRRLSKIAERQNRFRTSLALAGSAVRFAARSGWEDGHAAAMVQSGLALWRLGRIDDALDTLRTLEAWELPPDVRGELLLSLGVAYETAGRQPEAAEVLRQCLELAERENQPALAVKAATNLAVCETRLGDFRSSLERLELAAKRSLELGDQVGRTSVLLNRAGALVERQELEAASETLAEVLYWSGRLGLDAIRGVVLLNLGVVAFFRGEHQKALELYRQGHDILAPLGAPEAVSCRANECEVLLLLRDPTADRVLAELAREALDQRIGAVAAWAETELGRLRLETGRHASAVTHLRTAVAIADDLGMPALGDEARKLLAK